MRLAALGTSLTVISGIVALGKDTVYPNVIGIYSILLLLTFSSIRIISAINRALYTFVYHLHKIEYELEEVGFASVWIRYVEINGKDSQKNSANHAFLVATRAINITVTLYIIFDSFFKLAINWIQILLILFALVNWVLNELHIYRLMNPTIFMKPIASGISQAKFFCTDQVIQDQFNKNLTRY